MAEPSLRTDKDFTQLFERYSSTVYRVCYAYMKNPADTEDALQETFFRLIRSKPVFENEIHEKAWLIRTASNVCKNELRRWWRKRESIDDHPELPDDRTPAVNEVLTAVLDLPDKYKTVVYLFYYEGYTGEEIAGMLKKPSSTVRNYLHEARNLLRERLGESFYEE